MKKKSKVPVVVIVILVILFIVILALFGLYMLGSAVEEEEKEGRFLESALSKEEKEEEINDVSETSEKKTLSGKTVQENNSGSDGTWTVMVYMCGTDLETVGYNASINIMEMIEAEKNDGVNVLVNTGGTKEWANEFSEECGYTLDIPGDELGYYRVLDDGIELNKTEPLASMGDPDTLSSFLVWGSEAYPADKYMLILWDHGGGTFGGICSDELFDDDSLSLPEINQALNKADVPLEAIGCDACLMASLETAEVLQGYGHYYISSEESEPGSGWDYTEFLTYLSRNPGADGFQLGKSIVDSYMDKCEFYETQELATLSVIDLTRIPALSGAFKAYSGEMMMSAGDTENLRSVSTGAAKAENYGGNTDSDGYTDLVDLGDLIKNTEDTLYRNADNVKGALSEAVKYEQHGENRQNSNGISVVYPLYIDDYVIEAYSEISDNSAYAGFMAVLNGDFDSIEWEEEWKKAWEEAYGTDKIEQGKYDEYFTGEESSASEFLPSYDDDFYSSFSDFTPVSSDDYELKFTQEINSDGYLQLNITSGLEILKDVGFELYYVYPDSEEILYLGSDNNLYGDYETGKFEDNFDGSWLSIGEEFIYAELIEENEHYNLYSIPVLLNGEEMNLRATYNYDKEKYEVLGAYEGLNTESGQSGRKVKKLKKGDKIEFVCYVYDAEEDTSEESILSEITWSDDTVMEDIYMEDSILFYMFKMEDIFGNVTYSDGAYMEIIDGEVSAYEM